MIEMLPSHRTSASNACAPVSWQRWARCSRSWVAGGVPPLGAFNPPANEGVPTACRTDFQLGCPITAGQSRHSFEQFVEQFDLKCSFPYPFLSPGAWGPPQTRRQKAEKFGFFAFLVDFFAFRNAHQKRFRKNIEKTAKIKDFVLPKPSPNPFKKPFKSKAKKNSVFVRAFFV